MPYYAAFFPAFFCDFFRNFPRGQDGATVVQSGIHEVIVLEFEIHVRTVCRK